MPPLEQSGGSSPVLHPLPQNPFGRLQNLHRNLSLPKSLMKCLEFRLRVEGQTADDQDLCVVSSNGNKTQRS